jgi:hypothetical protein
MIREFITPSPPNNGAGTEGAETDLREGENLR